MASNNGIPPLLNGGNSGIATQQQMTADGVSIANAAALLNVWGVYLSNQPVLVPDSYVAFDFKKEWRIADYPMERGAFQSYNKVTTPYDIRITLTIGGKVADRQQFLNTLTEVAASLDLYSIVTPEVIYLNANLAHYDYRRTSTNGVTLLTIDLWFMEIRVTIPAPFTNTSNPSSSAQSQQGYVQPTTLQNFAGINNIQ